MLAALLVGCGDDTEVKTKEYYDAHLDEAKEVLAKCDFNTLKDGSNSYKNCVNAKEIVEFYADQQKMMGKEFVKQQRAKRGLKD
ncbi:EexN family lipoprotein [uncultured Campylobacter sp.]|uniref:EexN family lipoprotein n=1 Tax=uncultured Campylobacter sp. TaxID=218934 RepID=UPI002617616F|nr:EexN family lipoprotein [uncultured Campylobacter sp.]